jgi:GR25 family glycosyltransferase involved in LPS biosynthesis
MSISRRACCKFAIVPASSHFKDLTSSFASDYDYALRKCYDTGAPYIAMFEDDIIFAEGWLIKAVRALEELSSKHAQGSWIYLRLFFTETAMKWSDRDFWYRNMWLAFALGVCGALAALHYVRRKLSITNLTVAVVSIVIVPAFIALLFMIGKYSLAPMQGVVPMEHGGCCTQALIFPREQILDLEDFLAHTEPGQTDTLIDDYSVGKGLKRFALVPQVVQHVGRKSSRDTNFIDTRSVWAFYFEASHQQQLHEEHERMAAELAAQLSDKTENR